MQKRNVIKHTLGNGLTTLIVPRTIIPRVSIQLWYHVGSKDEKSGQKGIAHLIEHMIFKGTEKLSECDIDKITKKLSGNTNAFTSHDYTGYLFNFPSQHWQEALSIMSDCMQHCVFDQEHLNSELKAVIQELKLYKDDYLSTIAESLLSTIFYDHPYHHPIIGYKSDLWNLEREQLLNFYKHHYIPNNATLIVVGDVDQKEVIDLAEKQFGSIKTDLSYKKESFYHSPDLAKSTITIYRDIQQPLAVASWAVPGITQDSSLITEQLAWLLASGKGSRLYKKLVNELELVTDIDAFSYDLFDYSLFFIYFKPRSIDGIDEVISIISQEIEKTRKSGFTAQEYMRAFKKTEVGYLDLLESNQRQAYSIGSAYLATGDENSFYNYLDMPHDVLKSKINKYLETYLRENLLYQGRILPLEERDTSYWLELQNISDEEDARILAGKERKIPIGEPRCVYDVSVAPPAHFIFPTAKITYLDNGIKVLSHNNPELPKINLLLDLKAKYYYDPKHMSGLGNFVATMLEEGTKNYTADQLSETLETNGMSLVCHPGLIGLRLLTDDLSKGLELLSEILTQATFDPASIERVRERILSELKSFWDTPWEFVDALLRQAVYKDHPFSKNILGTQESIKNIRREDLLRYYHEYLSPRDSRIGLVGDLEQYDIKESLEHLLGTWQNPDVPEIEFPECEPITPEEINYTIMRDQIVLCYGGLSVRRTSPDYDKLLIFDQIFGGGVLGSMSSRLFDLREQSGLFYVITGSLISHAQKQPGFIMIKTIVSPDRLEEAEKAIEALIDAHHDVTDDEFEMAKQAIINSNINNFASNHKIAKTLLGKDYYNFPADYFDKRADELNRINKDDMLKTVKNYLSTNKLVKIRVGRV